MNDFKKSNSNPTHSQPLAFLLGFMGAGKSTLGKPAARSLGWNFIDLDDEIESKHQQKISQIFREKGEAYFRKIERKTLENVSRSLKEPTLLSCGGGTPCYGDTMEWMNKRGLTLYIKPPTSVLIGRLRQMRASRPMLSQLSEEELALHIKDLLKKREPTYLKSHIILEGDQVNKAEIVNALKNKIKFS